MEVKYVQSEASSSPAPPVSIPTTLPLLLLITEPESPGLEDKPDLELQGNTVTFPETLPDSPRR